VGSAITVAGALALTRLDSPARPALTETAGMSMDEPMQGAGYWNAVGGAAFHPDGTVRTYYVSADTVVWDYAPTGRRVGSARAT
jgi:hypothetical protein